MIVRVQYPFDSRTEALKTALGTRTRSTFSRFVFLLAIGWTAVICGSLYWNYHLAEDTEKLFDLVLSFEAGGPDQNEIRTQLTHNDIRYHYFESDGGAFPTFVVSHSIVWLFGISGLIWLSVWAKRREKEIVNSERALRKSEERLTGAVDSLQEGLALFDADDRLIAYNSQYERLRPGVKQVMMRGGTFEEMLRENVAKGSIMEAVGREEEFIAERMRAHKNTLDPVVRQFENGEWYLLKENHTPEGGTAVSFVNVTALKQAEEEARKSEIRLKEIFTLAPEAVITIGEDMRIQLFNQGAERTFGYKENEVLGTSIHFLMPERFREEHNAHVTKFDQSTHTYRSNEKRMHVIGLRKDGSEFPASAAISKLDLAGEKIFTVVMQDISERLLAEETLRIALVDAERANQAKSEFLATMSHELRTPLNAIIGFSNMIMDAMLGPPIQDAYQSYAKDINDSGEHLLGIISDILDISKVETGEVDIQEEVVNLVAMVATCKTMVASRTEEAKLNLMFNVAADLPSLQGDPLRLKQILLNLIVNSIKFTPEGGTITVTGLTDRKGQVILTVKDTGIGIAKEDIPKVLEKFGQVRNDHTHAHEGTGLGLPLAIALMERHDGKLEIESEVGVGTAVSVTFPPERVIGV